ncbi:MAG TPA: hypothetical protein VGO96_15870, partial [Pyrinomonadaceae bacterium]|nr:hypothetical protein [Pyrinomonadaceae bacterium]
KGARNFRQHRDDVLLPETELTGTRGAIESVRPTSCGEKPDGFRQLDVKGDELADSVYTSRERQKLKGDLKHKKATLAFQFFG